MSIAKFPNGGDAITANGDVARHPGISRAIDNRTVFDDNVVVVADRLSWRRRWHGVVRCRRNFSERFACDFLCCFRIINWNGNHVYVQSQNQMFAIGRVHVTRQSFSGDHQFLIQRIVSAVSPSFRVDMAGSRRIHLDFYQRAVLPENGKRSIKIVVVLLSRHIRKIMDHKVRREICVATSAIALRRAT